jgi:photosystem II stability/assembly factor-like uncharacterized protein
MNHRIAIWLLALASSASSLLPAQDISASYQWKPVKLGGGGFVTGMAIHPSKGGPTYCRTDVGGAYKLVDGKWQQLITTQSVPLDVRNTDYSDIGVGVNRVGCYAVESIAIAPSDPNILLIAAGDTTDHPGVLLKSTDAGKTFARTGLSVKMLANKEFRFFNERLAVKPDDANVILFGSRLDGLQRSTDGGKTWQRVPSAPAGVKVQNTDAGVGPVVFSSQTPGNAYCSVAGVGTFRSADAGATWTQLGNVWMEDIECSKDAVYASRSGEGVFKLESGAWKNITPSDKRIDEIAVDPSNPQRIYAAGVGMQLLFSSMDGGQTWKQCKTSSADPAGRANFRSKQIPWIETTTVRNWLSIGDLRFDPQDPSRLWFAEGMAIWLARNAQGSADPVFDNMSEGIEELVATDVCAAPSGKVTLLTLDRCGFFRASPAELDQFPQKQVSLTQEFAAGMRINASGSDPNRLVAVVGDTRLPSGMEGPLGYSGDGGWSGVSTDGGATWNNPFPSVDRSTLFNTPRLLRFGEIVINSADPANMVWRPRVWIDSTPDHGRKEIYYTTDSGKIWKTADTGTYKDLEPYYLTSRRSIAADPVLPDTYYANDFETGAIYKSSGNHGSQWVAGKPGRVPAYPYSSQLRTVPGQAGHLWFATGFDFRAPANDNGLYMSSNGGESFAKLPGVEYCWAVGFGRSEKQGGYPTAFVYGRVNGDWGVFRSVDQGKTWQQISRAPLGLFDRVNCIAGDPDQLGKVYVGFSGNGFAYGQPVPAK